MKNKLNILITSTSFIDTPGNHHELINSYNFNIIKERGPLSEKEMINCIDNIDGIICGDDFINEKVIKKGKSSNLKVISKYGIGLDKIDLVAAKKYKVPVFNCPGINKESVAEHTFALLLSYCKNISEQIKITKNESWIRFIGIELYNKKIGIIGFGNVGKEVVKIANAFGMNVIVYDSILKLKSTSDYHVAKSINFLFKESDIISLHVPLDNETKHLINKNSIKVMKKKCILINTSRGDLVNENHISYAIETNLIQSYLTDVLSDEPINKNHPFSKHQNILITPHVASRTYENVEKQATMAINNLTKYLNL